MLLLELVYLFLHYIAQISGMVTFVVCACGSSFSYKLFLKLNSTILNYMIYVQ